MDWQRLRSDPLARAVARVLALVLLVSLAAAMVRLTGHGEAFQREWIDRHVVGHGLPGRMIFIGLTAAFTAVGFPRHFPALIAGYAFGVLEGTTLATLGTGLGAMLALVYARLLGRSVVPARLRRRLVRVERWLATDPFTVALVLRIFPVGSNLATNLVAGMMRVPLRPFLLGSLLGFVPQNAIFALMGSGFRVDPVMRIGIAAVLLVISAILGQRLFRRMLTRQREAAESRDGAAEEREAPDLISRIS